MRLGWVGLVLGIGLAAGTAGAAGLPVVSTLSLRNGNWAPLPEDEMMAAAGDAALEEISSAGLLRIVDAEGRRREAGTRGGFLPPDPHAASASPRPGTQGPGSLEMELALVGPAETATMTITLQLPGEATWVSTASISVRRLDHAEIYRAFQHVGRAAAERLSARLRAHPPRPAGGPPPPRAFEGHDRELERLHREAQRRKHAADYAGARMLFERIAAAQGPGSARLAELATDELRYGLPVFEAKQSLLDTGRPLSGPADRFARIARAENLYRQIQAENPLDVARMQEAQRALDDLAVARRALRHALRASTIGRLQPLRIAIMEHRMVEGACPDAAGVERILTELPFELQLLSRRAEASRGRRAGKADASAPSEVAPSAWRYAILDRETDVEIELLCDRDVRVARPAARPQ